MPSKYNPIYTASFLAFWASYPRKSSKIDAFKAWGQRGLEGDEGRVVVSVEAHKKTDQWKKSGGEFIPYPAKFIRKGMDMDDLTPPKPAFNQRMYKPLVCELATPEERQRGLEQIRLALKNGTGRATITTEGANP